MKRYPFLLLSTLWALLLLPATAHAFAITSNRAANTIFVGESITLTLSGSASDLSVFIAGVTPDYAFFNAATANTAYVGGTTSDVMPDDFSNNDPAASPPMVLALLAGFDDQGNEALFDINDGPILDVFLEGIKATGPNGTTVTFELCTFLDCAFDPSLRTVQSINVTILNRSGGGNVPEPATLWLAAAALIAGGMVFHRKESKRS